MFDENVDQRTHLTRGELARRAHDVEPGLWRWVVEEQGLERAGRDVRIDEEIRQRCNAYTRERSGGKCDAVVSFEPALRAYGDGLAFRYKSPRFGALHEALVLG